ncbi:MAG: 4Fe-4S binding protein [Anaerolineales bacterium]|nr:4Fe-4S binding protein [Anaerolineales bacterium]
MLNQLLSQIIEHGYQGRVVSVNHLQELGTTIKNLYSQNLLDKDLYQDYLYDFDTNPPGSLHEAASIIIIAMPQPQIRLTFDWTGEPSHFMLPPTYPERKMDQQGQEFLGQILAPAGYHLAPAMLPKKLLAARSGLAVYGKNNIAYVPGIGSFFGLVAMYSDLPAEVDTWQEPRMMERCVNCTACQRTCPAGAITDERFLLHVERCITFHNEKPAGVPFPAWMNPTWHNCLIGCLRCQWICPANKEVKNFIEEGPAFTQEETGLFLAGTPIEKIPAITREKMHRVNLERWLDLLPRNLGALLQV